MSNTESIYLNAMIRKIVKKYYRINLRMMADDLNSNTANEDFLAQPDK